MEINTEELWQGWLRERWAVVPAWNAGAGWAVIKADDVDKVNNDPVAPPVLMVFDNEHEDVAKHYARSHNYWLVAYKMQREGRSADDISRAALADWVPES